MKQIRKSRLAALLFLLAALLAASGCSGSGTDDGTASSQANASAPSSPALQTQPGNDEASASPQSSPQASPQASATATDDATTTGDDPDGAHPSATPGAPSTAGAAKPSGSQAPAATADTGSASAQPEGSAPVAAPTATPHATAGGKPSSPPQAGQATPSPSPTATQAPQKAEITLSIVGDSDTGTILSPAAVELKSGDSVLDVLKRATRSRKMQMEYQGSGAAAYVEGIDNLYEFDKGAKSGWLFRVNGEFPGKSAGAYKLKSGDVVEWLYTLDMGKDVGKGADGKESGS
ncbi:DUF4430 domain-containing protein [Cohnella sp. GCM10012308]|uniref:DUF4430 domain-containing protein n=1 Tax=Cohnella sp. GCM10012308 TaxID=3317329 RepID=UPI003615BFDE